MKQKESSSSHSVEMARKNPDFVQCKEERTQESFFKVLQSANMTSEIMRALPHDFARSFSDKDLSRTMKIKAKWGSSWIVKISKNPRFYFMEKSGWEKFVRDNALGDQEFVTFTHKGNMRFTVNIFNKNGTEIIQSPQSRAFLASSRVKTEPDVKTEEVVLSSELSQCVPPTAAESGKKKLDEEHQSSRTRRTKYVVNTRSIFEGTSSSSISEFSIYITRSYLRVLAIPQIFAENYMPKEKTIIAINRPDRKQSWNVVYIARRYQSVFSRGWSKLSKEYPLSIGDICTFSVVEPKELLLVVSKP